MAAWLWFLVVCVGAALLGAIIYYGQRKTARPTHPIIQQQSDAATRKLYEDADKSEGN
jgi:hypothetical protein